MTTQMIGEKELKVEERLKQATQILDEYAKSLGLGSIRYNPEVEIILNLTSNDLKTLTEEACGSYGFVLQGYASFIQSEFNRQKAKLSWAKHNLDVVVAKVGKNYGDTYTKYEVRRIMVISDNEYASALSKIVIEASTRMETLESLAYQIGTRSEFLKELQKSKRGSKYG